MRGTAGQCQSIRERKKKKEKKRKKKIKAPAGKDDYDTARLTAIVHRNVVGTEPSGRLCSRLENRINSRCTYPSGVDIVPCTLFPVPCCAGRWQFARPNRGGSFNLVDLFADSSRTWPIECYTASRRERNYWDFRSVYMVMTLEFVCDSRQVEVMVRATWTCNMGRVKFIFIRATRRHWDGNDFLFIDDEW